MLKRTLLGMTLAALGCYAAAFALEGTSPKGYFAFELSRSSPRAQVLITEKTAIVIRADRDVQEVTIELTPDNGGSAGRWTASLWPLRATAAAELPAMQIPPAREPDWRISREVLAGAPPKRRLPSRVPRIDYRNSLLLLEPLNSSTPLLLKLQATPVKEAVRLDWLLRNRLALEKGPQELLIPLDPDQVRQLAQYLTDDEVRQWTGDARRDVFIRWWQRGSEEQFNSEFMGPENKELWPETRDLRHTPTRLLPGGYYFTGGARLGS